MKFPYQAIFRSDKVFFIPFFGFSPLISSKSFAKLFLKVGYGASKLFFFILFHSFSFFFILFILFSKKLNKFILFFNSFYFIDRGINSSIYFSYQIKFKKSVIKSKFLMVYVVNEPTMNQRFSYVKKRMNFHFLFFFLIA
jgi:hypothetical protein